jgi:hypothetical protein
MQFSKHKFTTIPYSNMKYDFFASCRYYKVKYQTSDLILKLPKHFWKGAEPSVRKNLELAKC